MAGFIKIMRDDIAHLAIQDPDLLCMLMLVSARASWKDNPRTGLRIGQARMGRGDFPKWTPGLYRATRKRLKRDGYATWVTTPYGTIVSLQGYSFADFTEHATTPLTTGQRQRSDTGATPNEEEKKKKKKKQTYTPPCPDGVGQVLWDEYLKTRTKKRFMNTEQAMKEIDKQLAELVAVGWPAHDIISLANAGGWGSLHPRRGQEPPRKAQPQKRQQEPLVMYNPDGSKAIKEMVSGLTTRLEV